MNTFEIIILNTVLVMFPLLCYLFYVAYSKNVGKKENQLFLTMALVSSLYCVIKFGQNPFGGMSILIVNIPLVIAYIKKREFTAIMLSILIVLYYYYYFHFNIWVLVLQTVTYYMTYWLMKKNRNIKNITFLTVFVVITAFFHTLCHCSNGYIETFRWESLGKILFIVIIFYIVANFVYLMFEKGEEILKYHMAIKELEQEKQIHQSLFRITHEIKNPIAVCKGYLDMFDVNNPEHSKKYVPIMKEEIERTLLLLQDFLNMSKIQIKSEILDINLLLDDVVTSFKPILKEKHIEIDFPMDDEEIYIKGDYGRLSQVFINIIKNSIEAIHDNEDHKLKINTKKDDKEIEIIIEDDGEGISKTDLEKICEPFFTTKKKGTGLGVALSYEIIKAHRGKIRYESELHVGTTVIITLPLTKEA